MKRLLLLVLAAIPLFAFDVNFIYNDYDHDGTEWTDEYWEYNGYDCNDGDHWVYYPHGHYCVYYVWWHPWYWDWYWERCHWHHHWDWDFFACGYYVVWYSDGGWWWRPRYGRVVRYKLPYEYSDFRWKAHSYGVNLPDKPGREINVPYKENDVRRLMKEKDPEMIKRLETEHNNGNLEKIRKDYDVGVKKEIAVKNEEYRKQVKTTPSDRVVPSKDERNDKTDNSGIRIKERTDNEKTDNSGVRIKERTDNEKSDNSGIRVKERSDEVNDRDKERDFEKSDGGSREPNEKYLRKPANGSDNEDNVREPQDNDDTRTKNPTNVDKPSSSDREQNRRDEDKNNRSVKTGR